MTPKQQQGCDECSRLWQRYTEAATAHITIVARRHQAALQNDSALLDRLSALEAELASLEIKARRSIEEHEAGHEPV